MSLLSGRAVARYDVCADMVRCTQKVGGIIAANNGSRIAANGEHAADT